jgi:glycosyltransferase involved in cell wall biosynthesis
MFSVSGAAPNRWRALIEGLSTHEVEISIAITSGYQSLEEKLKYGKNGYINSKVSYSYCNSQVNHFLWAKRINLYVLGRIYQVQNYLRIKKLISSFNPEIIYIAPSLDVFRVVSSLYTRLKLSIKLAMEITEFNDVLELHTTNFIQSRLNKVFNHYLERKILPRLDMCLVITDTLEKYYRSKYGTKVDIEFLKVPITVDFSRFNKDLSECNYKKPYVAYCGSSNFYKDGIDVLIRSFSMIVDEFPDLKLYIAAFWENDGPRMMDLINEYDKSKNIIYLGTLDRDDIPILIQNARVLALPRPNSRQAEGGFPTKLGEYLASGNPVCVTKVSEIQDYLLDNVSAFLAEPGDVVSFADSLRRALHDEEFARKVGENGKKIAQMNFDKDIQAKRIFDFLSLNIKSKVI